MEDQTHLLWEDPAWMEPLHQLSVLDYFMNSPFFDSTSNNMKARKEGKNAAEPGVLESMGPGLEYVVAHAQEPHLFIIRRQLRPATGPPIPQSVYYIIDKKVYQAPSLQATVTNRLHRCLFNVKQAFCKLQHDLDPLARLLQQEQQKEKDPEAAARREEEARRKPMPVRQKVTAEESDRWRRTDNIIMDVLKKIPAPQLPPEYFQVPAAAPQLLTDTLDAGAGAAKVDESNGGAAADTPPAKRKRV